jgi:hypothetical protein
LIDFSRFSLTVRWTAAYHATSRLIDSATYLGRG